MNIAARMGFNGWPTGVVAKDADRGARRAAERNTATPDRVVMELEPYRAASLHARGAVTITCLSGQLWITLLGELDDVILQVGQSHVLRAPVRDVVLSTAGARCPATFGIRAAATEPSFGGKAASPFRVEFA